MSTMNTLTDIELPINELVNTPIEIIVNQTTEWDGWQDDLEWLYDFRKNNPMSMTMDEDIPSELLQWADPYISEFYFDEWDDRGEWDNDKLSRWRTFYRINHYLNLVSISTMV